MEKKQFRSLMAMSVVLILFASSPIIAEEGHYQVVALQPGISDAGWKGVFGVFILDTKNGHCWTWLPPTGERLSSIIKYEGQVKPGKKPGDHITGPAGK